jgi:pimeloyl-ACP methyl ester carboxylesterase
MATFVLVHGSFSGGWVWQPVARELRAAGHDVYTPTLTGLGERSHLLRPDVGLETHIQDVASVLEFEDLHDVILVGWAFGGMAVTGAADRVPGRVARVVYLNGFVPRDGESQLQLFPPAWLALVIEERAEMRATGALGYLPPDDDYFHDMIPGAAARAWYVEHLVPHPIKAADDIVLLAVDDAQAVPRTYLHCNADDYGPVGQHAACVHDWFVSVPAWRFVDAALPHFAPVSDPRAVAELLVDVAGTAAP